MCCHRLQINCGRQGAPKAREVKRANRRTSIQSDYGMAACGFLGIFITRKMLGSLSEVSHDSNKPTKMITEQENNASGETRTRLQTSVLLG